MARMRGIAERVEQLLGQAVVATTPVAGGDICTSTRVRLSDGSSALVKTRAGAPDGFFETEARGLRWLAEPGVADVAEVLAVEHDCLVLRWIEPARPTPESAAGLGRALARLHASGARQVRCGRGRLHRHPPAAQPDGDRPGRTSSPPGGCCPTSSWPRTGATSDAADVSAVETLIGRMVEIAGPEEPPARIHGDLWSGNVVWSVEHGTLIDPAAHGGHRETDLAMLALFGLPHLQRLVDAYQEEHPLADGWEERQPLHQLFPLLVHAALFGGHYGATRRRGRPPPLTGRPTRRRLRDFRRFAPSQRCLRAGWHPCAVTAADSSAAARQHVLVVEDDRAVRESLRRSLEFNGYQVSTASDGAEALAGISGINPDAVVMDVMMPRLDGLETTRALRKVGNGVPDPRADRPRRRRRPGGGARRRCRRLPDQAVRARGAARPAPRAAAPGGPGRRTTPRSGWPSPT